MSARLRAIGKLLRGAAKGIARAVTGGPNLQGGGIYDVSYYDACSYVGDDVVGRYDQTYYDHCTYAPDDDTAARYDRDSYDHCWYGE